MSNNPDLEAKALAWEKNALLMQTACRTLIASQGSTVESFLRQHDVGFVFRALGYPQLPEELRQPYEQAVALVFDKAPTLIQHDDVCEHHVVYFLLASH